MEHKYIEKFEVNQKSRLHEVLMVCYRSIAMFESSFRKKTKRRYRNLNCAATKRAHSIIRKYLKNSELSWNSWIITIEHGTSHSDVMLRRGSVRFYVIKKD